MIWWASEWWAKNAQKTFRNIWFSHGLCHQITEKSWGVASVTRGRTDGKWKEVQSSFENPQYSTNDKCISWVWQEISWTSTEMPPHNLTMVWRAGVQLSFLQETFPLGNLEDKSGGQMKWMVSGYEGLTQVSDDKTIVRVECCSELKRKWLPRWKEPELELESWLELAREPSTSSPL